MYYKYFVISIKLYIFVYIKNNIIMPKSRHRKNHKKKATSFKQRTVDKVKSTNKEIMKIQEDLQEAWKKKQEESKKEDEPINLNPETL
jgi:Flp pilus assembly protein TadB